MQCLENRSIKRKVIPVSIMFSEFYFYLIAYSADEDDKTPKYYRLDRISSISESREKNVYTGYEFDEGKLREMNLFMFPGEQIKVRFEFSGPSVQAVLDRLPTQG